MRVQHRHIIYVQGYDPRGLAQYYRMFRTELRKFGRLYQLSPPSAAQKPRPTARRASWSIETKAGDWQTRTSYDFLRFEDLIQRDLAAPIWSTVFHAMWIYWRPGRSAAPSRGSGGRIGGSRPSSPTRISCCFWRRWARSASPSASPGACKPSAFPTRSAWPPRRRCSSPSSASVLKYTENDTYLLYLLSDTIWTWEFSHRQRPEWDARIDRFAQYLVNVARGQRCRGNRRRRPQFGIVSRHRNSGARAQARP